MNYQLIWNGRRWSGANFEFCCDCEWVNNGDFSLSAPEQLFDKFHSPTLSGKLDAELCTLKMEILSCEASFRRAKAKREKFSLTLGRTREKDLRPSPGPCRPRTHKLRAKWRLWVLRRQFDSNFGSPRQKPWFYSLNRRDLPSNVTWKPPNRRKVWLPLTKVFASSTVFVFAAEPLIFHAHMVPAHANTRESEPEN